MRTVRIITAYMIVVAVLVPVTAFLIQTFETKQVDAVSGAAYGNNDIMEAVKNSL
jgi:hypothetical protein